MPLSIRHCLTSRKTVLGLMLLLLFVVVLSCFIPQQFNTPPRQFVMWQQAHPGWLPVVELLGLHRLFTTPWFVLLLLLFLLSLAVATVEQFRLARRKTFGSGCRPPVHSREGEQGALFPRLAVSEPLLITELLRAGYFRVAGNEGGLRFVKHPWGYWGNFFLHLGILITIASSLVIATTGKRGTIRVVAGETVSAPFPWQYEEHGLFADPLRLDEAIRLDRVTPEFWPQGGLKNITNEVHFINTASGQAAGRTIALTPILSYQGLRMYQGDNFGNAFYVKLTDAAGQQGTMVLDIPSPVDKEKASYGNFDFEEIPYRIKAKYYADADRKALVSDNPLLVLRLVDQERNTVLGELPLRQGEFGRLGAYEARLLTVKRWTEFIVLDIKGMPGVFVGFFVIILGSTLNYFTIPREIHCQKGGRGFTCTWQGSRFTHLYRDEGHGIFARLQRHEIP